MNPKDFFQNQLLGAKNKSKTVVDELYKKPKKEKGKNMPSFSYESDGYEQQADLLYLPNDQGYQYALVVVDQGDRKTDAEPLKDRSSKTVIKALKTIYARKIINKGLTIKVDAGSEFNGDFKTELAKLEFNY